MDVEKLEFEDFFKKYLNELSSGHRERLQPMMENHEMKDVLKDFFEKEMPTNYLTYLRHLGAHGAYEGFDNSY